MICEKCLKEKDSVKRRTFFTANRVTKGDKGEIIVLPKFIKTKNEWCDDCAKGFAELQGNKFDKIQ